ncbi:MAG: hypothetical protein ACKPKO_13035 [Candidatus Fonsibacter sp.]
MCMIWAVIPRIFSVLLADVKQIDPHKDGICYHLSCALDFLCNRLTSKT